MPGLSQSGLSQSGTFRWLTVLLAACLLIALPACGGNDDSGPAPTVDPATLPGDPVAGAAVYEREGCAGCHVVDSDARRTGPSLQKAGSLARSRVSGQSAEEYLRAALLEPNGYVVDNYSGIMPAYDALSAGDLNDLIAYLMTLTG